MNDKNRPEDASREPEEPPVTFLWSGIRPNLVTFLAGRQPLIWILALVVGAVVAVAAIIFRLLIGLVQFPWLGTTGENVVTAAATVPWYLIVLVPAGGGLVVGILLHTIQPLRRTYSVADVIEASERVGRSLPFWPGISSALLTAFSLGVGASAGREGPVVHLGATLGTDISRAFRLPDASKRILLGCGVASGIAASFNAPIAGVLFAHEVVLGHYALTAFVPIVIASVVGALLSRIWFGDVAAFVIPSHQITSYWELPAFALLGVACAAVAILFHLALLGSEWIATHARLPVWIMPALGGLAVGGIGVAYPEILGVGYETTDAALKNQLSIKAMLILLVVKAAATSISLASRFGGGIFSPSLYLGAMAGGAFGLIAAEAFPELASSEGLYSLLGMGGVAASMLGAPISTTMIVFELTGGYGLSIALLLTVAISNGLSLAVLGRSYFETQLIMRGSRPIGGKRPPPPQE
ncbi:chloride channel protein [Amorphus orientalis]|uniref:CIC family chloride channel protein n=1 Tax=Amorphus orientalis TaxID=649198 RepID=A0AAE3VNC2_9HYPH|nr:chloride channel protein [Amorphus orientalis]MDQ0315274.1 CIC family chloride channel protein [Amorphus orientalis]